MPMQINNADEYNKVISVSWYTPPADQQNITYPSALPFSQMYPLVCIDIRNFLNQIYLFSDDHFRNTAVIDKTLKESLDGLLVDKVARTLVERLSSQYPGQIVQILTNLDHFEQACADLEGLLVEARSSSSAAGPITLKATAEFKEAKKRAEKRIFELVKSKIDDLTKLADYEWTTTHVPDEVSDYMQELTRYLSNIMSEVLLGLPHEMQNLIYFEALAHIRDALLRLPLEPHVDRISSEATTAYTMDVAHLVQFVESLPDQKHAEVLLSELGELRQTTDLMGLAAQGQGEEFFDSSKSAQRFGKVDKIKGAELLEKVEPVGRQSTSLRPPARNTLGSEENTAQLRKAGSAMLGDFRDRFGGFRREKS